MCGNDTVAVAIRFAMKKGLRFLLTAEIPCDFIWDLKKSLAIAVAMPWCT